MIGMNREAYRAWRKKLLEMLALNQGSPDAFGAAIRLIHQRSLVQLRQDYYREEE